MIGRVSLSALSAHRRHSPSVPGLTSLRHRVGHSWLNISDILSLLFFVKHQTPWVKSQTPWI